MPAVLWPRVFDGLLSVSAPLDDRLHRTRRLLERRYDEPWTVESLAATACLSREQFIRAFGARYGQTPHQYLIDRRIDAARHLLEETERSVTDVCLSVGFTSLGSFSATFKKRVGTPPSHYRRRSVIGLGLPPRIPCCFLYFVGGVSFRHFSRSGNQTEAALTMPGRTA